jgi:hypothetical protein
VAKRFPGNNATGQGVDASRVGGETLWDWLQLLIVPLALAALALVLGEHLVATVMFVIAAAGFLERVMNLGENRIGKRILRLARSPAVPRFPHSQAIPDRVHNSL